ncbi:MAG: ABC transporter permease [Treponemataceae bacterium]|nr:ABC transporter permease [Treponemataceae bacterium]
MIISSVIFLTNSIEINAISYSKLMGDIEIGIFPDSDIEKKFYNKILDTDFNVDGISIKRLEEMPFLLGTFSYNTDIKKIMVIPMSFLCKLDSNKAEFSLSPGEALVPSTMENIEEGIKYSFVFETENGMSNIIQGTVKGHYYYNSILENAVVFSDEDFKIIFENRYSPVFLLFVNGYEQKLLPMGDFQRIATYIKESFNEFSGKFYISFSSKNTFDYIERFIKLFYTILLIVVIIVLFILFTMAVSISMTLLDERKNDLGYFISFGMSKKKVITFFSTESFIFAIIGTGIGIFLSFVLSFFARFININSNTFILRIISEQLADLYKFFNFRNVLFPVLFSCVMPAFIYNLYIRYKCNQTIKEITC